MRVLRRWAGAGARAWARRWRLGGRRAGAGGRGPAGTGRRFRVDYPRRGRRGPLRWLPSWRQLLGLALLCCAALAALVGRVYASVSIEDVNTASRAEANVYYWADGTQMVSVGPVNRQNVPLSDIPPALRNAVIAAENATFATDPGFSVRGFGRAVVNMVRGGEVEGGSTITQQYVKNAYLTQDQTLERKLKELCLAVKLSRSLSKDDILQGYLNTSWFGRDAYGVQAAAMAYYGTDAKDLDPPRAALLAALLKSGEQYDPSRGPAHHRRAEARWRYVLDRQVELGLMSRAERAAYPVFPEPRPRSVATSLAGQTGYLVDVADKYVRKRTGLTTEELGRGGYRIRTTFDRAEVERLRRTVERVTAEGLDPARRTADRDVQIGAASVRPGDGAVLALYGGADATRHFTDNADTSGVPVGSAFKPFVLAAALQLGAGPAGSRSGDDSDDGSGSDSGGGSGPDGAGRVTPDSFYDPSGRLTDRSPQVLPLRPEGADPVSGADRTPTLREALVRDGDGVYRRLGEDVGLERVRDLAVGTGLLPLSMAPLEPGFSAGTSTPSAVRMAGAYATFAAGGLSSEPYSVTAVSYRGEPLEGFDPPRGGRVLDREVARGVTEALRDVAVDAVSPEALRALPPVAAGRTEADDRMPASWFVGYTDRLSTAVTAFRSRAGEGGLLPMTGTAGGDGAEAGSLPLRVWSGYMTGAPDVPGRRTG